MKHAEKDLSAYLDGELGERDRRRIEEHLAVCESCRRELDALERVEDILLRGPTLKPSVRFERAVLRGMRNLEEESAGFFEKVWHGILSPIPAAALMAVLLISVGLYVSSGGMRGKEDYEIAESLEMYEEYPIIRDMDLFEHLDVLQVMEEG